MKFCGLKYASMKQYRQVPCQRMWEFYCFIIIIVSQQSRIDGRCAVGCQCSSLIANCSQKGLTAIPPQTAFDFAVTKLDMSSNKCENIANDQLLGYMSLQNLNLANNTIEIVEPLAFNGLTNLNYLDLSINKISDMDKRIFECVPQLRNLLLSDNRISDLEKHVFSSLRLLAYLDISTNYLKVISDETFSHNPNLQFLSLKNNHIQKISDNAFRAQHKLIHLDLSNNRISMANFDIFKNLQNLEWLSLAHNKFNIIPMNLCYHNKRLTYLFLSNNRIRYLNSGTFSNCTNLTFISLAHNNIVKLYPHSLYGVFRIDHLDLSFNDIVSLSPEVFTDYREQTTKLDTSKLCSKYSSLNYNLTHLNLDNNNIHSLDYCVLQPVKRIEVLQLSRNHLSSLDPGLFHDLYDFRELDISYNDFRTVDDRLLDVWINNVDVQFAGNPWDCSCALLYKSYKKLNNDSRKNISLVCTTPEEFHGQTWDILEERCNPKTIKTSNTVRHTTTEDSFSTLIVQDAESINGRRMIIEDKMAMKINETTQEPTVQDPTVQEPIKIKHLANFIFLSGFVFVVLVSIILIVIRTRYIRKPDVDHLWWEDTIARKALLSDGW